MNKPNKSIIASRKLGLIHSTASDKHKAVIEGYEARMETYLSDQKGEASEIQIIKSYLLGLRGIRIGQEDLFCKY